MAPDIAANAELLELRGKLNDVVGSRQSDTPEPNLTKNCWCRICERTCYIPPRGSYAATSDCMWCWPCRCSIPTHQRCIAQLVKKESKCSRCGYKYCYFEYGSCMDFCRRYPCRSSLPVLLYLMAVVFAAYIGYIWFINGALIEMENFKLVFWATGLFVISTLIFSFWVLYMISIRKERFIRRHGHIVVFDHVTSPNISRKRLDILAASLEPRNQARNNDSEAVPTVPIATGAADVSEVPSGASANSAVYTQRRDQSSIRLPSDFETETHLAASTPVDREQKRQIKFDAQFLNKIRDRKIATSNRVEATAAARNSAEDDSNC